MQQMQSDSLSVPRLCHLVDDHLSESELSVSFPELIIWLSRVWGAAPLGDFIKEPGKWRTLDRELSNWISSDTEYQECWSKWRHHSKGDVAPGMILIPRSLTFTVQQNLIILIWGDHFAGSLLMSVVTSSIFPSRKACGSRVATPITQFRMEVDTIYDSWSAELVSTGSFLLMNWINLEKVYNQLSVYTSQTRCSNDAAFRRIRALAGAMSIIDTGAESLPMVAIFMPLEDAVYAGLKISPPLRELNTLSAGENIVTTRSKEISKRVRGWSITLGAM